MSESQSLTQSQQPISQKNDAITKEDDLLKIIEEQNIQIGEFEFRLANQRRVIDEFEKAHRHEKRDLWLTLRDKYACAIITGLLTGSADKVASMDMRQFAAAVFKGADFFMVEREESTNGSKAEEHSST